MLRDCSALAIFTLALIVLTNSTTVTFYVDHEVEQPLDYVEISAIIKVGGESLESTIEDAVKIIKDIENSVNDYCQTYSKSKAECKDNVETSPYSIRPQYEVLKKRPQFAGSNQITKVS
jgi:hypothetical protein